MYKEFFKNNFNHIKGVLSEERRDELIKNMINNFTMHVLSLINCDDYVIPNYVRKLLENYEYEYYETPDEDFVFIVVNFYDFEITFQQNHPVTFKECELKQKILKYSKINYKIIMNDDEIDDVKEVFQPTETDEVVDLLIINRGYSGSDIYVRDKYSPYLIHKFLSYDNDIYKVVRGSNRSITEYFAQIESEYNTSFFI